MRMGLRRMAEKTKELEEIVRNILRVKYDKHRDRTPTITVITKRIYL